MKYKNSLRKLESRRSHWESDRSISDSNKRHPGSFTKPGSQSRHKS